jgi:hypothetical protein
MREKKLRRCAVLKMMVFCCWAERTLGNGKWLAISSVVSLVALQRLTGDCFEAGAALMLGL